MNEQGAGAMSLLENEKKAEEREKAIWNETAKITAAYANGIAIALIAIGVLSPAISSQSADPKAFKIQLLIGAVCLIGSAAIHYEARRLLKGLR